MGRGEKRETVDSTVAEESIIFVVVLSSTGIVNFTAVFPAICPTSTHTKQRQVPTLKSKRLNRCMYVRYVYVCMGVRCVVCGLRGGDMMIGFDDSMDGNGDGDGNGMVVMVV